MPEWIIPASPLVQAVCTMGLVALTAWYAYWVRRQVRQGRDFFDRKATLADELVKRQAAEYQERERQQVDRAILTIVSELQMNAQGAKWEFEKSPRLLNTAYAANLWAVHLVGMSPSAFRALGDAYLSIERYNLLYGAAANAFAHEIRKRNAAQLAWQAAQAAIAKATEELKKDPATGKLVSSVSGDVTRPATPGE